MTKHRLQMSFARFILTMLGLIVVDAKGTGVVVTRPQWESG